MKTLHCLFMGGVLLGACVGENRASDEDREKFYFHEGEDVTRVMRYPARVVSNREGRRAVPRPGFSGGCAKPDSMATLVSMSCE